MSRSTGAVVIMFGAIVIVVGLLINFGAFSWFGRLPGDIRFETENSRVFIPITSMLVLSIGISLLLALVRRFF